jgi:hypothetical protein
MHLDLEIRTAKHFLGIDDVTAQCCPMNEERIITCNTFSLIQKLAHVIKIDLNLTLQSLFE